MAIKKYEPKKSEAKESMKWTQFWDMHSGGSTKMEPYETIYIEADETTAIRIFEEMFDRSPDNVTCQCCGEDYSVNSYPTLSEATIYHRNNRWGPNGKLPKQSLQEYMNENNVLVIRTTDKEIV